MKQLFRWLVAVGAVAPLLSASVFPQSVPARPKKLLFLTHAGLYKHPSLGPAEKAVTELGKKGGFEVTTLEGFRQDADKIDLSMITADYLAQFDGLMMMTNGDLPMTEAQKQAIVE